MLKRLRMTRWNMLRVGSVIAATALSVSNHRDAGAQSLHSTSEIAREATPATVTIIVFGANGDTLGQGSGFIVRPSGEIVTNWHVMRGAARAVVVLANEERYQRVEALDGDEAADLAVIKVPGFGLPTLTPTSVLPSPGERVVAIGSPLGLSRSVSEGVVSAVRLDDGRQLLQITAPISPGSSGGPVLDATGRVVAITTAYFARGQQLNFAVPVKYAMGLLTANIQARPLASVFGVAPPNVGSAVVTGAPGASERNAPGALASGASLADPPPAPSTRPNASRSLV
ncbi:MAG TPA: serine protease, partial [Gemmatimonadaceae bacterium]|nr:serine protease [Gemmatimonadaceae bacterium]